MDQKNPLLTNEVEVAASSGAPPPAYEEPPRGDGQQGPPVATVASLMPTAPPLPAHLAQAAPVPASAHFFPPEQLAVLDQQAYDGGLDFGGQPVATAVPAAPTPGQHEAPVVTTAEGVPIVIAPQSSATWKCGSNGEIKSNDPALTSSKDEILLFLTQHAASCRPAICVEVNGYHYETHYVERKHGDHGTRTEERRRRVDDFKYRIDLSDFVYPFGWLYSDDVARNGAQRCTVADLVDRYLASTNKLKTIHVRKVIEYFEWNYLEREIRNHVRALGWLLDLDVAFKWANDSVRIYDKNALAEAWENPCLCCLMHLTVVPAVALRAYRGDFTFCCVPSNRITALKSAFRMPYHPQQVMDVIRPMLWCPGWAGAAVAMALLDNALNLGIVAATGGGRGRRRRHGRRW